MTIPLTDDQVFDLAQEYMRQPGVREAMDAFRMAEEEYIAALRAMYPVPVVTSTDGTNGHWYDRRCVEGSREFTYTVRYEGSAL